MIEVEKRNITADIRALYSAMYNFEDGFKDNMQKRVDNIEDFIKKQDKIIDKMSEDYAKLCKSIDKKYPVNTIFLDKESIKGYYEGEAEEGVSITNKKEMV